MTPEEYLLSKLSNYRINDSKLQQYNLLYNDINTWTPYITAIENKKIWAIVNFYDINYKSINYTDDTDKSPTGYSYSIGVHLYGTMSNKLCCITNPIESINCTDSGTAYQCIVLKRRNNSSGVEDTNVPFTIIDDALISLASVPPKLCTPDQFNILGECIPKNYVYAAIGIQVALLLLKK